MTGENGILTKASQASEQTEIGEEKEAIKVAYNGVLAANEGKGVSSTELQAELVKNGYNATVTDNGNGTLTVTFESGRVYTINSDGSITVGNNAGGGNTGETVVDGVTIPEGFYHVEGTTVTGGLVISDEEGDDLNNSAGGNQYVWIPVDGIWGEDGTIDDVVNNGKILLGRYSFDSSGIPSEYLGSYKEETQEEHTYGNTIANDIEGFIDSVRQNGGYYIARFEASQNTETNKAESKYDKTVWNSINQPNAAIACQDLYAGVNSDLINSYAWDTAILFIQKYGQSNYSRQGRLQSTLANTGKATDGTNFDVQLNIYDMAGNCYEWTTETYSVSGFPCVLRGGSYDYSIVYTSDRGGSSTSYSYTGYSFRPLLYL